MLTQRRDDNEAGLFDTARTLGALVTPMDRMAGFDALITTPCGNLIVEVKDPAKRWTLTTREKAKRLAVEAAGGAYYIVETDAEMIGLVRGYLDTIAELLEKGDKRK